MTTPQQPIGSGFTAASTASEVIRGIDLTGNVAIVTGGYSGLGRETARVLSEAGATVIVPARDTQRAREATRSFPTVEVESLDLMDPDSIDAFAERFVQSARPLHLLINSAGIMASPLRRDSRGYESQFSTNHLGHFQLAARLLPALQRAGGSRVIAVSSWGHRYSGVDFEDPNFERRAYDRWVAYGQSKTANILFAQELDRRAGASGVRAFSLHPGTILDTGLSEFLSTDDLRAAGALNADGSFVLDPTRQFKTAEQGAATSVWCATSPSLEGKGGVYCENSDISFVISDGADLSNTFNDRSQRGVLPYAIDPYLAGKLWTLSEKLTGTTFL